MKRKYTARQIKNKFQRSMRSLSQDELLDVIGYSYMRIAELEMLFQVLIDRKVIDKKDFEPLIPIFEKKALDQFKTLDKRKKLDL
ncbi:hypothetical protein K9M79_04185 [Candidatus Woesearchaeota archaeon]|nr:hypothetical protein [Candidatus Woesearchaeota archaeon]